MLERRHRLTSTVGFTATTRGGRRAGSRTLVVHLARRDASTANAPRVGFVVGRAVGNAVRRNRVKRRLRHLVCARLSSLPGSSDLVVRALPAAADASYTALGRDLDKALGRLAPVEDPAARSAGGGQKP